MYYVPLICLVGRCASEFTIERPINQNNSDENGAVPVMTFLQCHAPLFPNKLQSIMHSWYVLWVDVQVNLQSSDRLIKKIQTESWTIPVMNLHYLILKPLAAKSL